MLPLSRRSLIKLAALGLLAGGLPIGCGTNASAGGEQRSSRPRQGSANVPQSDLQALAASLNAFAFDLYHALGSGSQSLFFSPYSIAQALTLVLAGARGQTAEQMRRTLHYSLPPEQLHPAANALSQALAERGAAQSGQDADTFKLTITNDLWGQTGYRFQPAFLDLLAEQYGAGVRTLDFQRDAEAARAAINQYISDQTSGKIRDLMPPRSVAADTRLVLTNAIYFKSRWTHEFSQGATRDEPFTHLDGQSTTTPMMHQTAEFDYGESDLYQVARLPYQRQISMLVILPAAGRFAEVEKGLDARQLGRIVAGLSARRVDLTLPKFGYQAGSFSLKQTLVRLGMADAFQFGPADFSGMDGTRDLFIGDGYHQATVTVDEQGTEAAAATALGMAAGAAPPLQQQPPVVMRVDRPFIALIQDDASGAICFIGRIADPRA